MLCIGVPQVQVIEPQAGQVLFWRRLLLLGLAARLVAAEELPASTAANGGSEPAIAEQGAERGAEG